jgi:hypothetical protein
VPNNRLKYVDPSGHEPCEVYNGSECVVRYFNSESDTAGKYAFNLFENGSLNCAGCMTSSIQAGFEQIRQNQANDHNQAALTIASLVSGGRLVYQGGKWVVAGLQGVYDWLGQLVLGACIRTPICAAPFLRLLEVGSTASNKTEWIKHHVFPQQFRKYFEKAGINIDRFTIQIPKSYHIDFVHPRWNNDWEAYLTINNDPTKAQLFEFGMQMINAYGLRQYWSWFGFIQYRFSGK